MVRAGAWPGLGRGLGRNKAGAGTWLGLEHGYRSGRKGTRVGGRTNRQLESNKKSKVTCVQL